MKSIFILLVVAVAVMAFAQGRPDVPFQVVDRGANSGEEEQGIKVFRTERAFEEYVKDRGDERMRRLIKQVDWNADQVIIVFGGLQRSSGFGVDVKRIANIDIQRLVVEARITKPKADELVAQALTTPYVVLKTQRQVAAIKVKFLTD